MGKRGPPKEPTKLRLMRGNPSKTPAPANEPQPPSDAVTAPDYLTPEEVEKFHQLAAQLVSLGVMSNIDIDALARYCGHWSAWKKHKAVCDRGGDVLVMRDESGKVKYAQVGPSSTLTTKHSAAMDRLAQQFGMTPSSRASIVAMEGNANDPLAAFLKKHA
jgi:P27 family predicted phage terminase small subunit